MKRLTMIAVMLVLVALVGCSTKEPTEAPPTTGGGTNVAATVKDFSITTDKTSAPAGAVTFKVANTAAQQHEFVVARTELAPTALPVKGTEVDETASGITIAGKIEPFSGGTTESKTLTLAAGKYVIFCNISGHYQSGMHTAFTVTT
jgi:uncharacterized cupredoxin-like copper-binding protein